MRLHSSQHVLILALLSLASPVASGQLQVEWTETWGAGADEAVFWSGIDGGGDLPMAGQRSDSNGNPIDLLSLRYDSTGTLLYAKSLVPSPGPNATLEGTFVDPAGLLTASGQIGPDALVFELAVNGDVNWASSWNGSAQDHADGLSVDVVNSLVYSAGGTRIHGTEDVLVLVHDRQGALQAAYTYDTGPDSSINGTALHHGPGGTVSLYLAGNYDNTSEALVMKLDVTGGGAPSVNWALRWKDGAHPTDAWGLALDDASGEIYVTGSTNQGGHYDFFVLNVATNGTIPWAKVWGTAADDDPVVHFLDGRLLMTGCSPGIGATGAGDALLMELNPANGAYMWGQTWGGCMLDIFTLFERDGDFFAVGYTTSYQGSLSACDCGPNLSSAGTTSSAAAGAFGPVSGSANALTPFPSSNLANAAGTLGDVLVMKLVEQAPYSTFCSSQPNSTCSPATMRATGSASISANDLELHSSLVPNQPGLFFYSAAQTAGGAGVPFGDGLRCVGSPGNAVFRLPVVTGLSHELDFAVNNTVPPASNTFVPGQTLYFQAWYRDPSELPSGFNLSDGLSIPFVP